MSMKCPHCAVVIAPEEEAATCGYDDCGNWQVAWSRCPSCRQVIIRIALLDPSCQPYRHELACYFAHPKSACRPPLPSEVPDDLANDYNEAALVLQDSPKASAALSRRCLQHLLREKANVKHQDLGKEIQEVLDRNLLPAELAEEIDAVRNIGNFAAHAGKSTSTGEIIDVEPGEAEWNLDVLDGLFEWFFVRPAKSQARKDALNAKLAKAGKPPMKSPKE